MKTGGSMEDKFLRLKQEKDIVEVASSLGMEAVGGKAIRCFNTAAHRNGDKRASFVFQSRVNRFICYACGIKGSVIDFVMLYKGCDFKDAVTYLDPNFEFEVNKTEEQVPKRIVTPEEYLSSRGLSEETIQKYGLKLVEHNRFPAIQIPIQTGNKYRMLAGNIKYLFEKDTAACLYKCGESKEFVIICEGEFDALMLNQVTGFAAWTSTSGVRTFEDLWIKELENVQKIYIAFDNDAAGKESVDAIASRLGEERCYRLEVPQEYGKDWNDFFLNGGTKELFEDLVKNSQPLNQTIASKYASLKNDSTFSIQKIETGLKILDRKLNGGLRTKNTYTLAGLEKSGKTAYLLTMVNSMLLNNHKIGYIDTELGLIDISTRLAAINNNITFQEAENDNNLVKEWTEIFQENFQYAGLDGSGELLQDKGLDFELAYQKIDKFVQNGAQVIIIDNLSSFVRLQNGNRMAEWQILSSFMLRLIPYAKEKNIVIIFVLHTKKTDFKETPKGMLKLLKENRAGEIFSESVAIVGKPTLSDVYGGGMALSQTSGTFLIWRPFQKFTQPHLTSMSRLIIDSLRHGAPSEISLTFHGEKQTFTEDEDIQEVEPIKEDLTDEMEETEVMPL